MLMIVAFRLPTTFFSLAVLVARLAIVSALEVEVRFTPPPSELKTKNYGSPIVRFKFFHPGFLQHLFELLCSSVSVGIVVG